VPGRKLLSIFDNSTMYVDYQVAEADLPVFKVGMPLTVSITSLGKDFQGNIIYISPQIDTSTMNYVLRVSLDNGDGLLKGGMFADAKLKDMVRQSSYHRAQGCGGHYQERQVADLCAAYGKEHRGAA
jgi:HlyD family secretion protein